MKYNFEKLPKVFKKKWLAALRSGKFKQGTGELKSHNSDDAKYCCLGVAGEICGCEGLVGKSLLTSSYKIRGLSKIPAQLRGNLNLQEMLAGQNDGKAWQDRGKSFKQIADWIEKYL